MTKYRGSMNQEKQVNYTTINHNARLKLGLTVLEYCLCDLIYNLANNPTSNYPQWCYSSKEYLAFNLGVSKQTIHTLITKLVSRDLIKRHLETKHLQISINWYETVVIRESKESLPPVKKVDSDGKDSLLPTVKKVDSDTIYYKDSNKDTDKGVTTIDKISEQDLEEIAKDYKVPVSLVRYSLESLKNYCASKDKTYKNYKAALRNFVLKDARRAVEQKSVSKAGIDGEAILRARGVYD